MGIRRLVMRICAACAVLMLSGVAVSADAPVATTKAGQVRGAVSNGIHIFKGVRYGATTEGRRFMAPLPPKSWTGVVDALDYGNQSPQASASRTSLFTSWSNPRPAGEDLLFLNVWTPGLRDGKKRPVMVWYHGGGHVTGSGSSHAYEGTRLAKKGDVVVVTVNHRLNTFGYLYLAQLSSDPALADSGNVGNLDMLLSLQWVRDNIAEFGGDPGNVLIFGESGGGAKVSTLMTMPSATGLFHRAVVQSGSSIRVRTPEAATASAKAFMQQLGLKPDQVAELRKLPMAKLAEAMNNLPADGSVAFAPVLDGRSLPRHPFDPDAPPASAKVPLLVGTIKDENTLLIGGRDPSTFTLTWETLPQKLKPFTGTLDANALIADMRKLNPKAKPSDVFFTVSTVRNFRNSAIRQAELKSAQGSAPAFLYELVWETPVEGGKWKAPHALEIGMVFDNVAKSESMSGIGPDQQKIADQMSDAWIKFARSGNPGWPAYDASKRATMVFDVQSKVVNDFNREERLLLSKLPSR
ncbi:MAG: carboxylesterase/lipase family protein [Candidatus Obscuribacterales bacterium]|nr:carboxylesterase/lipase family protein [Steroidobacteraceae bacterium]